jgi:hypothetical protein
MPHNNAIVLREQKDGYDLFLAWRIKLNANAVDLELMIRRLH